MVSFCVEKFRLTTQYDVSVKNGNVNALTTNDTGVMPDHWFIQPIWVAGSWPGGSGGSEARLSIRDQYRVMGSLPAVPGGSEARSSVRDQYRVTGSSALRD